MTVLPYVTVSLIAGIGSLDAATARRLFLRVGALTLVLWGLALGAVFLMPLAFPPLQSASFFSTTIVEERARRRLPLALHPVEPLPLPRQQRGARGRALQRACSAIALMGVERKERLIEWLQVVERALARANRLVVRLTPLGPLRDRRPHRRHARPRAGRAPARLPDRLRGHGAPARRSGSSPASWRCLTPIPARRVLQATRDVLITAFMTADLFIVLPLADRALEAAPRREHGSPEPEEGSPPDVIVPAFYNFPHAAKMLSLSFVLFAAWYSETTLSVADYPRLAAAGIVSLFGSINVALPFLLDFARVPADTFQLFVATGVLNSRFGTLAAAIAHGRPRPGGHLRAERPPAPVGARVLRYVLVTAGLTAATLAGLAVALRALGGGTYEGARLASEMGLLRPASEGATVLAGASGRAPGPAPRGRRRSSRRCAPAAGSASASSPTSDPTATSTPAASSWASTWRWRTRSRRELGVAVEFAPVPRDRLEEVLGDRARGRRHGRRPGHDATGQPGGVLAALPRRDARLRGAGPPPGRVLGRGVGPRPGGPAGRGSGPAVRASSSSSASSRT